MLVFCFLTERTFYSPIHNKQKFTVKVSKMKVLEQKKTTGGGVEHPLQPV